MAKVTETIAAEVFIVNTAFLSPKGTVQAYACRQRGCPDAKTLKISPVTLKGRELFAGDALYISNGVAESEAGSNYRLLRSGHVAFELPTTSMPAALINAAVAASVADNAAFTTPPASSLPFTPDPQ